MDKIIKSAQDLQQNPTFLTGENIVEESDTFIDLINKVKDVYDGFTQQNPVDINATAKPMFEDNSLEASFIAEAEKKCTVLSKIANGIAVFFTATSTAFIGFIKWIGECLGLVKKANAELDGSGASVKMEDQSKDESTGEESAEDENANKDIPGKDTTPISNEEVDKAVVAAQQNPSEETIVNALEKSKVLMDDINTASDPKKMQLVRDTNAAARQAEAAVKSGKVPSDKGTAKKVGKMIHAMDEVATVAKKDNPTPDEINKATGHLTQAVRVASIPNTKGEVSEKDKAKGTYHIKNGEKYQFFSDGELMNFLNEHLGEGNPVESADMANKKIKWIDKKGKVQNTSQTGTLDKLQVSIGNTNRGAKIVWKKTKSGKPSWVIEFAEDELDACIMMLESAIMEYLGEDETFVVEYADGTTEEMTSFIMEAYDEEVSAEEAAFEEINNHWYR